MSGGAPVADDERTRCCGKDWGSHVHPLWSSWKLLDVAHSINIVDNEMCILCTRDSGGATAPVDDQERQAASLRSFDTALTIRVLPRHAEEHR